MNKHCCVKKMNESNGTYRAFHSKNRVCACVCFEYYFYKQYKMQEHANSSRNRAGAHDLVLYRYLSDNFHSVELMPKYRPNS